MKHEIAPPDRPAIDPPYLPWVLAGFFASFLVFFVRPVFLSGPVIQYFHYVPFIDPIGVDLKQVLTSTKFVLTGRIPYGITYNLYPPLTFVLFRPLLLVSQPLRYSVLTLISVAAYGVASFAFPLWMGTAKRVTASLMLVFVTGLLSYGFQFELERGQFNIIAVVLAYLAIWIYHRHPKFRLVAYSLFSVAVQLKLFPFAFILMLIHDWRDWKHNLRRVVLLTAANVSLLFIMGVGAFAEFVSAVRVQSASADWVWRGNHSIQGFVALFLRHEASPYAAVSAWALTLLVLACLALVAVQAYRRNEQRMDPCLLLACTIAALLLPAISNDYTLTILAGPLAILLARIEDAPWDHARGGPRRVARVGVIVLFSIAYSATLFSYTNKPATVFAQNDFAALMVLLLTVTLISTWPKQETE